VLARRFGDCKDKASLIHAMLKVAGVDSRLVLLRMRHLGTLPPEPASLAAFNHAIVYVPKLELYLDGTAAFHGAAELPIADRVANALIVDPDGKSTFLTTPEAKANDNATHTSLDVTLRADGGAAATGESRIHGVQAPEYRRAYESAATRKATFEQGWAQTFPGLRVTRISTSDIARLDEAVQVDFEMDIPRYAEALPSALRFHPFGTGRGYAQTFASLVEREHDLVMNAPWSSSLSFRFTLPAGYQPRELPPPVNETSPFGSLRMSYRMDGGKLLAECELILSVARVSAADYPAFRAFLGRVDQAFARKVTVSGAPAQAAAP
jgi:hypothetical protein